MKIRLNTREEIELAVKQLHFDFITAAIEPHITPLLPILHLFQHILWKYVILWLKKEELDVNGTIAKTCVIKLPSITSANNSTRKSKNPIIHLSNRTWNHRSLLPIQTIRYLKPRIKSRDPLHLFPLFEQLLGPRLEVTATKLRFLQLT